jgi:hypothetical protein
VVSKCTGTKWDVDAWLEVANTHSTRKEERRQWMENRIQLLYFEVRRM